jgi:hypothetical protein
MAQDDKDKKERGEKIVGFLVKVAHDPNLKAAYAKDADKEMKDASISKEDREVILSGDLEAIKDVVGSDGLSRIVWQPPTVWQ